MAIPLQFATQARDLMEELRGIKEFRRGSASLSFRKCGKKGCMCASKEHPGHPQTKLTVKEAGRTKSKHLPDAESVKVVTEQIQNHERFLTWCKKWIELNEQISDLKLKETLSGRKPEEDTQEKKRRRRSSRKSHGRSNGS